jgi:hypothetical protein
MIEIVSPGNKASKHGIRAVVRKVRDLLQKQIHLLIVGPFPAGVRDPHGLHAAIFEDYEDDPLQLPPESPLSLIAYECDDPLRIYLEPFAVGDRLANMSVYYYSGWNVEVPLEETYMAAWDAVPISSGRSRIRLAKWRRCAIKIHAVPPKIPAMKPMGIATVRLRR